MKRFVPKDNMATVEYNSSADLSAVEEDLAFIMYACGLDPSDLESNSTSIDEIIYALRKTYPPSDSVQNPKVAATYWARNRHFHMIRHSRKLWWQRRVIKGIIENA